jgi:hypothetical protein
MVYTRVNPSPNYWAAWVPTLGFGAYEVQVFVPGTHATSWQTDFAIHHSLGTQHTLVDEYGTYNQWVRLGTYCMMTGGSGYVSVSDNTGESVLTRELGVYAVRFVPVPGAPCVLYRNYLPTMRR